MNTDVWVITTLLSRGLTEDVYLIACTDCGVTPYFASADEALRVAYSLDLPRPHPRLCPRDKLETPTPYQPGMEFDAARREFREMQNQRRRKNFIVA